MSTDGAHLGVNAERALDTILGGKPSPAEDEQMDAETFRTWIKTADREDSYGETARLCARYLLEYLTAHPEDVTLPLDQWLPYRTSEGVWDKAMAENPRLKEMDLTGFMVGWAFNAARRCIELPPAPNPALMTIG